MSLLKKIKDKLGDKVDKTKLRATMFGPRAVGKTSVLASVFAETCDDIAGTQIYFRPVGDASNNLHNKRLELLNLIDEAKDFTESPNTGVINATSLPEPFDFEVGVKNRTSMIDLRIQDFPGEYLVSHPAEVSEYLTSSEMVILAIDTPYLMEENGRFNDEKNNPSLVIEFFRKNVDAIKNKLILLVPLKCERYFHDNRINEVTTRVKYAYASLFDFCRKQNIACVAAPIQTLGGVEFDSLVATEKALSAVSKLAHYRFYGNPPKYKSMFCVQPFYYLLSYMANYYEWSKAQPKGFINYMVGSMASFLKDDDVFLHEVKKLSSKALTDKFGYEIIVANTILNVH